MSKPGWYPNPTGSGPALYWDGQSWHDCEPRSQKKFSFLWPVLGIFLILGIVALLIFLPRSAKPWEEYASGVDPRSDKPTVKPWDEREHSESPDPEPEITDLAKSKFCTTGNTSSSSDVSTDGRLRAGGISVLAPDTPSWMQGTTFMPWMSEHNGLIMPIVPGWVAGVDIGTVQAKDGFLTPQQSAKGLLSCMASSWLYQNLQGYEIATSEQITIDGISGWHLKADIHVNRSDHIQGDTVDIYVLDLGRSGEFSVAIGTATIGHEESLNEVQRSMSSIKVG